MNRSIAAITVGIFAAMAAYPAAAADLAQRRPYKAPAYVPYAPMFTWQGFYIGVNGGYGWGSAKITGPGGESTLSPKGGLIGVTTGYNWQAGNVVYGLEGDVDYSTIHETNGAVPPCASCEVHNNLFTTARGRLGYAWNRWLPFVTGGLAYGDIQMKTPGGGSQVKRNFGWTLGGGVEYAFAGPWSTKLEYLYTDLGTANCDAAHCGTSVDTSLHVSAVRVGINYRY